MLDTSPRWSSAAVQQSEEVGPVFRELSVAEQRYQTVLSSGGEIRKKRAERTTRTLS